nr:hypothetical protein [Tanacetum cinerariifolium]
MESEDTLWGDFLYDFMVIDGGSVQYVLGLRRSLILLGTLEKEGYIVKMEMGRIKNKLESSNLVFKQIKFKQLGHDVETGVYRVHVDKRVWFKVELKGLQGNREAKVFQVSNDDATVAQRRLKDKQL